MPLRRSFALFTGLLLAGAAACHDSTSPGDFTSYYLRTVDGEPLPYVTAASGADTSSILGAHFAIGSNGEASLTYSYRSIVAGQPPSTASSTARFTYTQHADTLVFTPRCPPYAFALCAGPSWGTLDGELLELKGYVQTGPTGPQLVEIGPRFEYIRLIPD
jgi:hypothetical protein